MGSAKREVVCVRRGGQVQIVRLTRVWNIVLGMEGVRGGRARVMLGLREMRVRNK